MSKVIHKENSNITYYVDENKRTVVAKLTNCKRDVLHLIENVTRKLLSDSNNNMFREIFNSLSCEFVDYYFKNRFLLKDTYYGKAKCHENNTWDEEYGMRVARSRMLAKYYNDVLKIVSEIITDTTDFKNSMEVVLLSLNKQLDKYITNINVLTKEDF